MSERLSMARNGPLPPSTLDTNCYKISCLLGSFCSLLSSGILILTETLRLQVLQHCVLRSALVMLWDINLIVLLWTNVESLKICAVSCLSIHTTGSSAEFANSPISTPLICPVFFLFPKCQFKNTTIGLLLNAQYQISVDEIFRSS